MAMPNRKILFTLFVGIFLYRLLFGLCQAKWMEIDELQTYLIGLKFYATGAWPFFGPDVNGVESSFQSQIPGALEGLMVGLPFYVLPLPEAPFLFLNLMTAAGVLLLAWFIYKRIPGLSFVWLCLWITVAPWSLHEATYVINPAYLFLPGVLFFIGFMEATPLFRAGLVPLSWANALMGLSLFWIMQFHFSYVYLLPLAAFSLLFQLKQTRRFQVFFPFLLGALVPLAFVIPTYLKYGLARNDVASGFAVPFNWYNVREFWTILARFLSLACFEMPRFIGENNRGRFAFLENHPLLLVPGAFLWIAGLLQPFVLLFAWFKKKHPVSGWKETKWLLLALLAMVEVSFWFTIKLPLSHIYFILFPFIMGYSCYCWVLFADKKYGRVLAKIFLVFGVFFQLVYALTLEPQYSIYPQRARVAKAIEEKNYHLMGERRPGSLY
jgi:hypothetical protein